MADTQPKKRTFRKYTYRGVDLDQLLDMTTDQVRLESICLALIQNKFSNPVLNHIIFSDS